MASKGLKKGRELRLEREVPDTCKLRMEREVKGRVYGRGEDCMISTREGEVVVGK